jgi:uncharacterized cupin superfamily protein
MVEEREGWYVVNVEDGRWFGNNAFGRSCSFEKPDAPVPQIGIHIFVLEPGKPNCRYHREEAQEDLLVLSGYCRLLANGEERRLRPWDFVHLPAGTSPVVVGDGDGPCAVLIVGHREPGGVALHYPKCELARRYNAETPEETPEPAVAYADVGRRAPIDPPPWPPR